MEMRGINIVLLSRFLKGAKAKQMMNDHRIEKVIDYIHSHIYDDISIGQLADVSCLSRGYMVGLFKEKVGMAPQQYINKLKIEKAQLMLLTDDIQIKNVAYELGFTDHSYFIRLFKKITGFTPQNYREINGI